MAATLVCLSAMQALFPFCGLLGDGMRVCTQTVLTDLEPATLQNQPVRRPRRTPHREWQ